MRSFEGAVMDLLTTIIALAVFVFPGAAADFPIKPINLNQVSKDFGNFWN
jgi:hypothetical protein